MQSETTVLIPTLNERKNLERLIPAIFNLMPDISVLIVDDSSKDGTDNLIKNLKKSHPSLYLLERTKDFGYGKACIDGFRYLEAQIPSCRYVVTMDADFSHDFRSIPEMLKKLESNDVVVGSRYIVGGKVENWSLRRRILSRIANFYVRLILKLPIKDATTGFNAYRREALSKSHFDSIGSNGYAFLVELKYKLVKSGAKIIEYPIVFSERREGQSKMSGKIIWESIILPWKLIK